MTDQSAAGSGPPESSGDTAPEPVGEQSQEPPGPPTFSPPTQPPTQPPPGWRPPRQRLRDRLFRFRSVLAVGVAGLIIGGGAGAGGMAIANRGPDGGHLRGPFPGQHRFPGGGPYGQFPGPGAGQGAADGESQQGGSGS